jgi:(S)-mandelate dehydrogenase
MDPNRHTAFAQLDDTPQRHFYTGRRLERAVEIGDLRAMAHKRLPRFALEYLEAGAEDEATMARERTAYAEWRFTPRMLVDVSHRTLETTLFGRTMPMPLIVAPTGLNGVFWPHADAALAEAAAKACIPFVQSTMSNDRMGRVAEVPGLRHWWQLYVFGGEDVWRTLIRHADDCGCEALVVTLNAQIFGNRAWESRTRADRKRLSAASVVDAAFHPRWLFSTILRHGMPVFENAIDFIPEDSRGFFESAFWIRDAMSKSLAWDTIAKIRETWRKPLILKGILNLSDVERAVGAGVDGIVLSSHGGRQLDWTVAGLDLLPEARRTAGDKLTIMVSGGVRRGTDVLKAMALGADAVMVGRAPLYGVAAAGAAGVSRALDILRTETARSLGLLGASGLSELDPTFLRHGSSETRHLAAPSLPT